jgi:hypothetical protein
MNNLVTEEDIGLVEDEHDYDYIDEKYSQCTDITALRSRSYRYSR